MAQRPSTNAGYAQIQLAKHGVDRYPTIARQYMKLVSEVGELADELNGTDPYDQQALRGELADVALCLYNLAAKLCIDLDEAIHHKVRDDIRRFAHGVDNG